MHKLRHGVGNTFSAVVFGDTGHREPLEALAEVGWLRAAHTDHSGLRKGLGEGAPDGQHTLGRAAHAVEQQHQLLRLVFGHLHHDGVVHVGLHRLTSKF